MARNLAHRLLQSFLQLNLYGKSGSDEGTILKELISTRIYVCSLAITILIVAIASAFLVRNINNVEYSPTQQTFSQLVHDYPYTLHCPCSTIGIPYDKFVTTHVTFHQVCSSDFIQQTWIDMVFTEYNTSSLPFNDFRLTLSFFWQLIAGFRVISNRTWTDTMTGFGASHIFSPIAIAEDLIQTQVQTTLDNQINSAQTILARNLLSVRRMISGNQMVSALVTNYYLRYPPGNISSSSSPKMSPRTFNDCSCLSIEGCPHPATFNDSLNHVFTIPGMIADCLIIDGTLASTFECYYDETCLSLLHPSLSTLIKPLSNTTNKYFLMNTSIQMLLNELMIDEIITEIRFDMFYSECNPSYCSYSFAHHFDALFIITTIIAIFGGLSFVIRLIAPFIATMILRWKSRGALNDNAPSTTANGHNKCKLKLKRFDTASDSCHNILINISIYFNIFLVRIILNRLRLFAKDIQQTIVNLNLFEGQSPRTPINIVREQLLARIFIFFRIISSIAAEFDAFLVVQNQVETIEHPSLDTYQQLYNDYSDTLQCPCSQVSVPYEAFLNITFVLHQVCSSDFVSSIWLNYLASFDPIFLPSWAITRFTIDFRVAGASYFQLLATFCALAKSNIEDAQYVFGNTRFINDRVLAPSLFDQQTQALIKSYIETTQNDFERTVHWIKVTLTTTYMLTGTNTNFDIIVSDNGTLTVTPHTIAMALVINGELRGFVDFCVCETVTYTCSELAAVYTNGTYTFKYQQLFPELPITCIPLDGYFRSKISW